MQQIRLLTFCLLFDHMAHPMTVAKGCINTAMILDVLKLRYLIQTFYPQKHCYLQLNSYQLLVSIYGLRQLAQQFPVHVNGDE